MKKIYIGALALSVGLTAFAQSKTNKGFEKTQLQPTLDDGTIVKTTKNPINKAPGDTIWEEDFTSGLPTGWYVLDNTGNNYDWVINNADIQNNNATPPGYTNTTAIASTSGGNHMLIFGDEYNRVATATGGNVVDLDAYFQTAGIQVNNALGLSVVFQQSFRRCCAITPAPEVVLAVSTDSTFSTNFQEYDIIQGIAGNVASADPMPMSINISAIAANYTGKIWLRFHIKSGTSHYYWMIDDIAVVESPTNDMVTQSPYYGFTPVGTFGFQYTRIPVSQIQAADFSMIVNNIGTADQTGTNLTVDINDGSASIYSNSTADITLTSLATDTLELLDDWTPPATVGIPYTVTLDILSDSTDQTPNNNGAIFPPFQVSNHIVALDDHGPYGNSGSHSTGNTEHEIGNYFEAVVADTVSAIQFLAGTNTIIGTNIDAVLYRGSAGAFVEVARSANHIVAAADTATPMNLLLNYDGVIFPVLEPDSVYFMAIHSHDANFQVATSGAGPAPGTNSSLHSNIFYPNATAPTTTFGFSRTPVVRLNINPALRIVGVNEVNNGVKFNVFPNPSNGMFNVNISANGESTVKLTVKNIVGQTIITENVSVAGSTQHQISLNDYSKGIYFLTVGNETVKLIVE